MSFADRMSEAMQGLSREIGGTPTCTVVYARSGADDVTLTVLASDDRRDGDRRFSEVVDADTGIWFRVAVADYPYDQPEPTDRVTWQGRTLRPANEWLVDSVRATMKFRCVEA